MAGVSSFQGLVAGFKFLFEFQSERKSHENIGSDSGNSASGKGFQMGTRWSHPASGRVLSPWVKWCGVNGRLRMWKMLVIVFAGALAMSAAAQTEAALAAPDGGQSAPSLTIRRLVPEVQVVFSAMSRHGRPELGLGAPQIRIFDNGIAVPLTSFRPATGLPLRIALLLDASDSMGPGFAGERQAALAFLRRVQRSGCEQIFSLAFATSEEAVTGSNQAGTRFARQAGGQTALYDALVAAAGRLQSKGPAPRVLILFSDGEDDYSRTTLAEAMAMLQQENIAVYSITAHSASLEYPGDRVLQQLAAATGGRAFVLRNYEGTDRIFAEVENELRAQYVAGFRPVGRLTAGEFHSVKVVALKRGTTIRTRPGYRVPSY